MTVVFLALWALYTLHALYRNLRGHGASTLTAHALQLPLLLLACWWAWDWGVFSRYLWSPVDIGVGLVVGHLLFAFSLMITHRHLGDVARHVVDWRGISRFINQSPDLLLRFAGVSVIEELVYRVAGQGILLQYTGVGAAIGVTALAFCVLHKHFFENGMACAFEFLLFALVLGVLYYHTQSLAIVALAHLVRNLESAYLEYCALLDEHHDSESALRKVSCRHGSSATEST